MSSQPVKYQRRIGLLDLLMCSVLDRRGTMDHLLTERPYPPYILSSLIGVLAVLVLPSLYHQYSLGIAPTSKDGAYAVTCTLALAFVLFVLALTVMLRLLGISAPLIKVIGASTYPLVAVVPFMVGYYAANLALHGELTIVSFFVTGHRHEEDWLIEMFPLLVLTSAVFAFLVFLYAIRAIGNLPLPTAFMISLLSLSLILGAFTVGATFSAQLFPYTSGQIWDFFPSLIRIPELAH